MIGQVPFFLKPRIELYANLNTLAENVEEIDKIEQVSESDVLWMDWVEDNKILVVDFEALKKQYSQSFTQPIFVQPETSDRGFFYPLYVCDYVLQTCV